MLELHFHNPYQFLVRNHNQDLSHVLDHNQDQHQIHHLDPLLDLYQTQRLIHVQHLGQDQIHVLDLSHVLDLDLDLSHVHNQDQGHVPDQDLDLDQGHVLDQDLDQDLHPHQILGEMMMMIQSHRASRSVEHQIILEFLLPRSICSSEHHQQLDKPASLNLDLW